jgi:hypothetical protein
MSEVSIRYGILNIIVFIIIILLVSINYDAWTPPTEVTPETRAASNPGIKIEFPKTIEEKKEFPSISSHMIISEKNIFSPARKDFPIQTGSEGKRPIVRPQIILYGVTIAGDYQSASIANPGRPLKKGEREAMTLKIGDRVGGYKLSKILPDRIALEAMEDTFEVLLYDPNKPKQRIYAKAEQRPAAITSTLPVSTVSSSTSSTPSQITPSQEAPKASELIRETRTQAPENSSRPPYPYPTLRSRRTGTESSPLVPIEPAETLTRPKSL